MIIYLYIINKYNTQIFSKDVEQKSFFVHMDGAMKLKKGHNSHNNWWVLP